MKDKEQSDKEFAMGYDAINKYMDKFDCNLVTERTGSFDNVIAGMMTCAMHYAYATASTEEKAEEIFCFAQKTALKHWEEELVKKGKK
jgi:hypothetical protein